MNRPLPSASIAISLSVALAACGGTVVADDAPDAPSDTRVDSGADTHHHRDVGVDTADDTAFDSFVVHDTYVDPGCGDATPPPILDYACDPFAKPTTCGPGEACFPYVRPSDVPCGPETYGATCAPAGTGTQGTPCSEAECAAGFVCVVTGGGNVCAALCKVGTPGACSEGLVCSPTDVPGYGVCL